MRRIKTLFFYFIIITSTYSQNSFKKCLQGTWEVIDLKLNDGDKRYIIFKGNKQLTILLEYGKISFYSSNYGFLNSKIELNQFKESSIIDKGNFFCTYEVDDKTGRLKDILILDHFSLSENCNEMSFGNSKNYDAYRISELPESISSRLNIDISKLFLNVKKIKSSKVTINNSPNIPTKMYLVKGNEVEIIEEKDNWLKIRYYGKKTIEGWVKKEDVE